MTYTIKTTSESESYTVTDLSLNSELSVRFVGKGYVGYGQIINTNLLQMLENFANTTSPGNPLVGQLWYNTSINKLRIFNGSDFVDVSPDPTRITYSTIGNLSLASSNITGEITNGNVGIAANGTGIVNVNRLALTGTTVNRVLFTAANGMVMTNSMQYTPTSDTLTVTNLNATNIAGSLTTSAQTAITSVGTLTSLNVGGTVVASTVNAGTIGNVGATITGASVTGALNGSLGASTPNTVVATSVTTTSGGQLTGYHTGPIGANTANTGVFTTVTTVSGGQITGYHTGAIGANTANTGAFTTITTTGTATVNSTSGVTAIANGGTSGVGNIGASGASFNTVFAKATTAQYADLAELYESDRDYEPGTIVEFGGEFEITEAKLNSKRIAGVISTNPAYLMNSEAKGKFMLPVALQGRVPCKVIGPVYKGDMLVSAGDGHAIVSEDPKVGTVIGKSLENMLGGSGIIEVVVGRC
jgi:hypothetical protein